MITITIHRDENDNAIGARFEGHAGFAKAGHDIVCSAASVLIINTINAIEQFTEDAFRCDTDEKNGWIDFVLTETPSEQALLLIKSMLLGVDYVRDSYGTKYITYTEEV